MWLSRDNAHKTRLFTDQLTKLSWPDFHWTLNSIIPLRAMAQYSLTWGPQELHTMQVLWIIKLDCVWSQPKPNTSSLHWRQGPRLRQHRALLSVHMSRAWPPHLAVVSVTSPLPQSWRELNACSGAPLSFQSTPPFSLVIILLKGSPGIFINCPGTEPLSSPASLNGHVNWSQMERKPHKCTSLSTLKPDAGHVGKARSLLCLPENPLSWSVLCQGVLQGKTTWGPTPLI